MAAADSVTTTAGLLQVLIHSPSERFLERPQIDFVRPGAASLAMNLPVRFGNGFNVEHHDCSAFSHRLYSQCHVSVTAGVLREPICDCEFSCRLRALLLDCSRRRRATRCAGSMRACRRTLPRTASAPRSTASAQHEAARRLPWSGAAPCCGDPRFCPLRL